MRACFTLCVIILAIVLDAALSFSPLSSMVPSRRISSSFVGTLCAGRDDEEALIRASRSQRSAGAGDRVVELKRPLGLVLDADEKGNVYVEVSVRVFNGLLRFNYTRVPRSVLTVPITSSSDRGATRKRCKDWDGEEGGRCGDVLGHFWRPALVLPWLRPASRSKCRQGPRRAHRDTGPREARGAGEEGQ